MKPPTNFEGFLQNTRTGEVFEAIVKPVTPTDWRTYDAKKWLFDWQKEGKHPSRRVFKLVTPGNERIVHGLISLEMQEAQAFLHLIENAYFNKGPEKLYKSVPGVLMAFACQLSFDNNGDGYVAFDSKTRLIPYYQQTFKAKVLRGQRMYLDTEVARWILQQNKKRS